MCALTLLSVVPGIKYFAAIPGLVCFIVYWVQIADYSRRLARPYKEGSEGEERWEEDFEHERGDRRGRPDDRR